MHAPTHTLPPNTTCTWTFHGRPGKSVIKNVQNCLKLLLAKFSCNLNDFIFIGDLVWMYFSSFTQYSLVDARRSESSERDEEAAITAIPRQLPDFARAAGASGACAVELRIWDGGGADEAAALLGRYCDSAPSLCARAALANATRSPRPCAPPDGYVSAAPLLSLAATTLPGTATHPLAFSMHYEFIDARLEGALLPISETRVRVEPAECARRLTTPGIFSSPRNALWFGRGGARRLRCVYRLQVESARIELRLLGAAFGREPRCATRLDPLTGRTACIPDPVDPLDQHPSEAPLDFDDDETPLRVPHLRIYESPWPGYRVRFIF